MVVIRLKRMGKKKSPFYRVVVADSKNRRDGKVIEELGYYSPCLSAKDKVIKPAHLNVESYQKWVTQGACPSDAVQIIAKQLGIAK